MNLIVWLKNHKAVVGVIVLVILLLTAISGLFVYRKTITTLQEELTTKKTILNDTTAKLTSITEEFSTYKKEANVNVEKIKEPVIGTDGKALLDGKGNAIYRTRFVKSKYVITTDEKSQKIIVEQNIKITSLTNEVEYWKSESKKVEERGSKYRTTLSVGPNFKINKGQISGYVRIIGPFGAGLGLQSPYPIKFKGNEFEGWGMVGFSF